MSELSPRPPWQFPAALLGSVAMVAASMQIQESPEQPQPNMVTSTTIAEAPMFPSTTSPEKISTTTTTLPEFIGPEEPLGQVGFLVDGGTGLRFDAEISRGVDCRQSYEPDDTTHARGSNEARRPFNLQASISSFLTQKNIMFFGEETSKPRFDNYKLSHGWAIRYNPSSNNYTIYKFEVEPLPGRLLRGRVNGRPIGEFTLGDLRNKVMLQDDKMTFLVQASNDLNSVDGDSLQMTIACKD